MLHHQRKAARGDKAPAGIDDVYGSRWYVQGAGSVIYFEGKANDPLFQLKHFKSPADEIGPLWITHDHETGKLSIDRDGGDDLLMYLRAAKKGLTAVAAAKLIFGEENARRADVERVRRRLEKLTATDLAHKKDGMTGSVGGRTPTSYYATTPEPDTLI